jgi:hypothetical protein
MSVDEFAEKVNEEKTNNDKGKTNSYDSDDETKDK